MTASQEPAPAMVVSAISPQLPHMPSTPADHLFHDSADCPFGAERVAPYGDYLVPLYPRRCNWCNEHNQPTPS